MNQQKAGCPIRDVLLIFFIIIQFRDWRMLRSSSLS